VLSNDLDPSQGATYHMDALQPSFYMQWQQTGGIDAIVTSPWFSFLDVAVPLAVHFVRHVACIHVPGHYLTDAHTARRVYLQKLHLDGRLAVIMGLEPGPLGRRCIWLLIFKTRGDMNRYIIPRSESPVPDEVRSYLLH
jgi:hypothetical protein